MCDVCYVLKLFFFSISLFNFKHSYSEVQRSENTRENASINVATFIILHYITNNNLSEKCNHWNILMHFKVSLLALMTLCTQAGLLKFVQTFMIKSIRVLPEHIVQQYI